jgi:hypothetical protein
MALLTHRTFTFPAVLAVSAGLGLSVVGLPAPASAVAPVIAGVPEPPDRQKQLEKALITEKDVPAGYVNQDMDGFAEILGALLTAHEPGSSPCDMAGEVSSLATGSEASVSVPTVPPGASPAPSAPAGPSAPEPVKASPPPPLVTEPDGDDLPPTAGAVFLHEETGAVAIEALSAVGEDAALDMVDQVQEVLEECPLIEIESAKITTQPMAWNPQLGDESITATVSLDARFFGIDISARLKVAQVAYRDVALTVGMIGADDPKDREFKKLARTAVRKLVTTSGISTTH